LSNSKPYWDYEALAFIRSSHLYEIFLTFSLTYLVYGIVVFVRTRSLNFGDLGLWLALVLLFFAITICFLVEVILHGVAFVTIDDALFKQDSERPS
jgi:hypothetical protein